MRDHSRRRKTAAQAGMRLAAARRAHLGFEALEPRCLLAGNGLTAQYFHNSDFTGLAETRIEAVAHNWGAGSPAAGVHAETFSVRWTGQIEPRFSETYTFRALSDEGVRVWIDGQLVVDDWSAHLLRFASGTIALTAGQRYDIRVDYFENTGRAQIELTWFSASQPSELVPAEQLYESHAGLWGTYRDATGGSLSRRDDVVDFNWGASTPSGVLDADGFNVTWTGQIRPEFSEQYTFSTISDDGVRLWIGGELVIDNWTNHSATEDVGFKWLEAGKWYDVRLEYYEDSGDAEIELRWASDRQTGGLFEIVPRANLGAAKATPVTFKNPLGPGADPFVTRHEGYYYMTRTLGNRVVVERAASLENIHPDSGASDAVLAWNPPDGTNYSHEIWAPELHRLNGNWYIYVAASNGNNDTHRMHVLERLGDDPFGPFTYKGQIAAATDRWAIDGTVLEWQGSYYFVWSGWPGSTNGQQNLYIALMRDPWTLRSDRVLISSPTFAWERHGLAINEGPQILIHDGQLHIIYSGSGYWRPEYALGRLTYNGVGSLLDAASWTKSPTPVFSRTSQVVGTGHASFVKSPDGTEDWIVYHAHHANGPPSAETPREVHIQPFTYHADGTPNFGSPLPPGQPMTAPSTGPDAERPFVTGDFNADGIVNTGDYDTWKATFGMSVFPGSAADGNGNGVVDAADVTIWRDQLGSQASVAAVLSEQKAESGELRAESQNGEVGPSTLSVSLSTSIAGPSRQAIRPVVRAEAIDGVLADWRQRNALAEFSALRSRRAERSESSILGEETTAEPLRAVRESSLVQPLGGELQRPALAQLQP